MTKPEPRGRYDFFLALRAAARVMLGEPMPSPETVASTDVQWESDVARAIQMIKYHEDYAARPSVMQ